MSLLDEDNDTNCSIFTERQHVVLAGVRAGVAAFCGVLCLVAMVFICCFMKWKNFFHRLILYLTLASFLYMLVLATQVHVIWNKSNKGACIAIGFLDQFASWLQLLFALTTAVYLFMAYTCNPNAELHTARREIIYIGIIFVTALVFSLIPIPYAYGLNGGWCWIERRKQNCEKNLAGTIEQWMLWYVWLILFLLIVPMLLCTAAFLVRKKANLHKGRADHLTQSYKSQARLLLLYTVVYFMCSLLDISAYFYPIISEKYDYQALLAFAILEPIGNTVLPVLFVVHLWHTGELVQVKKKVTSLEEDLLYTTFEQSEGNHLLK